MGLIEDFIQEFEFQIDKLMNKEEQFWRGKFGNDYTSRNINYVESNYQLFRKIFSYYEQLEDGSLLEHYPKSIKSIIEFGAGSGQNILALQRMFPDAYKTVVEINDNAIDVLKHLLETNEVIQQSILDYKENKLYDLVLSKGLLIHIHPDNINKAYEVIYNASNKYILICEYYNPTPVEVNYRGNTAKLWKRDFCGDMLDKYTDLKLLDYGFAYHRDKYYQDDISWFLMEKK